VSKYKVSDLLLTLGQLDPAYMSPEASISLRTEIPPYAVAAIARESILIGSETSKKIFTGFGLIKYFCKYFNLSYDGPKYVKNANRDPLSIIMRHAFEQFRYQESDFEELARSIALFRFALAKTPKSGITKEQVDRILNAPLEAAMSAAIGLYVVMIASRGIWLDNFASDPALSKLFSLVPGQSIINLKDQLAKTPQELQVHYSAVNTLRPVGPHLDRWRYNPLYAYPLVKLPNSVIVGPHLRLLLFKLSPNSLMLMGSDTDSNFLSNMGLVIETYVGMQLELISGCRQIFPEVMWGATSDEGKSIDWFVVLPECILMIEVKNAMLSVAARAGDENLLPDLKRIFNKARDQLNKTFTKFQEWHPSLTFLPRDRQIIGIIVTATSMTFANSSLLRDELISTEIPVLVMSLRDLEHFVPRPAEDLCHAIRLVVDDPEAMTYPSHVSVGKYLDNRQNPILESAIDEIPIMKFVANL
jgi:hypothetical protein